MSAKMAAVVRSLSESPASEAGSLTRTPHSGQISAALLITLPQDEQNSSFGPGVLVSPDIDISTEIYALIKLIETLLVMSDFQSGLHDWLVAAKENPIDVQIQSNQSTV
ncbi:hypothetical protein [Halomarina rubra]|uniref:Uncharacterized protein n=1 Tax=Halomarina rubra TaxID=2071873 RepID=A0ABD6ASM7_9EURY|nr:hypothetical protein [Halomarina rubra]